MAKSKSSNPVDSFRKLQKSKELKKEQRQKVREGATVKRDTRDIEAEIADLTQSGRKLDGNTRQRLANLEGQLAYVKKVKDRYVADHPEARDRVFGSGQKAKRDGEEDGEEAGEMSHLYDTDGRLRDPKRSVYYDAVYNPYGVPPPGMPYRERTASPVVEADEGDDISDDEIVMPEGPPPGMNGADSDDDSDGSDNSDEIPLPDGPPPSQAGPSRQPPPPLVGPPLHFSNGVLPGAVPMMPPHMAPPAPMYGYQPQYMPPPGPSMPFRPPRPPNRQNGPHDRPPPTMQDPLSDAPSQTYQGYRMAKHETHELPPKPDAIVASDPKSANGAGETKDSKPIDSSAGTISAAPQLRDLRKEATAFVPRGIKKRRPGDAPTVNAAPSAGEVDEAGDLIKRRRPDGPGLMGKLQGVLAANAAVEKVNKGDDDYQEFLAGLGDLT